MATTNSVNIDEENGKATPRFRLDPLQLERPAPHIFDLPATRDIQRLALCLDREEMSISDFGERLASYDGLSQYVIAVANHTAAVARSTVRAQSPRREESAERRDSGISEPTHAAAFLGLRGLRNVLSPLAEE
ncbi:MAG: hypothetical protein GY903_05965 [Fuerstiella sp.]|nr:hypothetical protein [Fuerstiella sp.]MCP4854020.1 hypothetical protein [Fuerstiella sp.]